jgi:glycosyltransferase involved in cell wall biosynthesis
MAPTSFTVETVNPLRALFVAPHILGDGPTRFVLDLVEALVAIEVAAEVFSIAAPVRQALVPHEAPQVPVTYGAEPGVRRRRALTTTAARLLGAASRATVVVASNEVGPGHIGAFFAGKALRKPTVAIAASNLHESLAVQSPRVQRVTRWEYPHFDAVACVSEGVVASARDLGVPGRRLRVIKNGANLDRVRRLAGNEPPEWLPAAPFIAAVGTLTDAKGFDFLIEAHARVRKGGAQHELVIMGEGPKRGELEASAEGLGVTDTVHMPGFVQNPFPVIARSSAFCMPSRFEGLPLALLEGLALQRPVIASDCVAGPREILDGGRYGELVGVGDVDALAAAISEHLSEPGRLEQMARDSSDHLRSFTVTAAAERYADLLREVASGPLHASPAPALG